MKIKLRLPWESQGSLVLLGATKGTAKFGFKVAKALKAIRAELDTAEKQRKELVERLGGKVNEKTAMYEFDPPENKDKATAEFAELLEEEIEIPGELIQVPVDLNGLSANDMIALEWLLKE